MLQKEGDSFQESPLHRLVTSPRFLAATRYRSREQSGRSGPCLQECRCYADLGEEELKEKLEDWRVGRKIEGKRRIFLTKEMNLGRMRGRKAACPSNLFFLAFAAPHEMIRRAAREEHESRESVGVAADGDWGEVEGEERARVGKQRKLAQLLG